MRQSRIRAKLSAGEPVFVTTLHLTDPSLFEMASLMGFDGLWLDMEHHAHSMETAQILMRATRVGSADFIARPAKGEFMRLGRMLEAGAQGLIYPRCDDADEARELVKWAKFPPLGSRGMDGGNPDNPYCFTAAADYIQFANDNTFVVAQIEDPKALEHVDEIAAVDGIDVLFLGPADFSSLSGVPGQIGHPKIREAEKRISAAVAKHGKHWGRPVASAADAEAIMELGARFITHGSDIIAVREAWRRLQNEFSNLGMKFENRFDVSEEREAPIADPHFAIGKKTHPTGNGI